MQANIDGSMIHYVVSGPVAAPSVLLWHGAGCTLRMWDHVVARLEDRFRLIRFDVRGVGMSDPAPDPSVGYTFERYSQDANEILDQCGVERCHVWGMAWGSRAALAYCFRNPKRVISAAFYDASIDVADPVAQREGARVALRRQTQAGVAAFTLPEGWNVHRHPDEVPKAMAAAGKFDLLAAALELSLPLLVATGDHDPNLASSRRLVDLVSGARLVVFENVGHGSVLQRPDLATAAFVEFQRQLR